MKNLRTNHAFDLVVLERAGSNVPLSSAKLPNPFDFLLAAEYITLSPSIALYSSSIFFSVIKMGEYRKIVMDDDS